jgi:hypothetical protein
VNEDVELQKFSQMVVPTMCAPASSARVTTVASELEFQAGIASVPKSCGTPATAMLSFKHTVFPLRSSPSGFPRIRNLCAQA